MMRAIAGMTAFALAASLGACAQSTGVSNFGLFGGSSEPSEASAAAPAQTVDSKPAEKSPASSARTTKKPVPAKGGTAVGSAAQPAVPTAAPEKQAGKDTGDSGFSLGSLSQMTLFTGSAPDSAETAAAPVATYTMLAHQIHACWFTPGKPQLTNHGFHAEVAPNGSGDAKIIIYEKAPDNKRGLQVFRITISGSGSGSVISSDNRRLDSKTDAEFKADLARWAKGDDRCRG